MTYTEPEWGSLVPEVTLREQQLDALHSVWRAFYVDGKRFVMLEAPTGVGKSIIQLALCRYVESMKGNSYIVTPQRQLQDQMRSWERLRVMKGRGAYPCELIDDATAATAPCISAKSIREANPGTCSDDVCPYYQALKSAVQSPTVVHNYASLMAQSNIGKHFGPRSLLCLDEAHTAVSWIRNYMTCEFTPEELSTLTSSVPPTNPDNFIPWIRALLSGVLPGDEGEFHPPKGVSESLKGTLLKINANFRQFGLMSPDDVAEEWASFVSDGGDSSSRTAFNRRLFADSGTVPWTTQFNEPDRWHQSGQWSTIPLKAAPLARVLTGMGEKVLLVSATILNKALACVELGLASDQTELVRINSAFDPAHRPVIRRFVGSMASRSRQSTTPKVVNALIDIALSHDRERGMVHTVSHALAWDIASELRRRLNGRPVEVLPRGQERDQTIAKFLSGGLGPSAILVGPSMLEGIDGKDDSCRWQAMVKAPWMSMGDPVVRFLNDSPNADTRKWAKAWYSWKSAQQTVQGFGRVCRTPTDRGVTYLLDSDFERIIKSGYMPDYVLESIS